MIMSRKLARRRMLMWSKQNIPGTGEVIRHYVFKEGKSALEDGYTGAFTRAEFADGKIVLTPTFHEGGTGESSARFANSSLLIRTDFSNLKSLCIECYYDGAVTFTGKDEILVGYGNGTGTNFAVSNSVNNTTKSIFVFDNLDDVAENGFIRATYTRDPSNSTSSSFYITNIWFENTSSDSSESETPEIPTVQTFDVIFSGENDVTGETYSYDFDEGMSWETFVASDYNDGNFSFSESFTVPYDTGNYVLSSIMSYCDKPVLVKDFDSGNPDVTIYAVEKSKVDSGELTSDFADENIYIESNRTYSILDIATVVESNTPTESSDRIYLFDSTRTDNFLFGQYIYQPNYQAISANGNLWPPTIQDEYEENVQPGTIILKELKSTFMSPLYYDHSSLIIKPNNNKDIINGANSYGDNMVFVNNIIYNGEEIGTHILMESGENVKVCFNAYIDSIPSSICPSIKYGHDYYDDEFQIEKFEMLNSVTINTTEQTTYEMDICVEDKGYFVIEAVTGCGKIVITDIWIEKE